MNTSSQTSHRSNESRRPPLRPLVVVLLAALSNPAAYAAVITVDSSEDASIAGHCSLRDAVAAANTDAVVAGCSAGSGADSIQFAAGVDAIMLRSERGGTLDVSDTLAFDGRGTLITLSRAQDDAPFRIVQSETDVTLTLRWMKLSGGLVDSKIVGRGGAGVYAQGPLTLERCEISGNLSDKQYGRGGGIHAYTTLSVIDSVISGNATTGESSGGGGVYAGADATIVRSVISGNATTALGSPGGGIGSFISATLDIADSTIADNSTFGDASAGGGILTTGTAVLRNSTVSGNTTAGGQSWGGGGYAYTLTLVGSTLSGNTTSGNAAYGGGFFAPNASISNSTLSGNSTAGEGASGGGLAAVVALRVNNSTIVANSAVSAGGGGIAIFSFADFDADFNSSLVFANTAPTGQNMAFGFDVDDVVLTIDGRHNLIGDVAANVTLPADTLACDPLLQSLAANGGPTSTHALASGSCAIDVGSNPDALEFDQRGSSYMRMFGDGVDIGAFERQPVAERIFVDGFELL